VQCLFHCFNSFGVLAHGDRARVAGRSIGTSVVGSKEQNLAWADAETAALKLA
jgi:hypothetical protein